MVLFFFLFEFGSFKNNGPSMSIFNTLHTENLKKVMGCVVLCTECCLDFFSPVLQSVRSCVWDLEHPSLWLVIGWINLLCTFSFTFLFSFLWRHHMLVLCLYECFNHFHGGRILYLCSCTILFFSARKSVMYEINQSHLFEKKKKKSLFWTL